jgi:DNA-binding beta-propeller fold protein YncE
MSHSVPIGWRRSIIAAALLTCVSSLGGIGLSAAQAKQPGGFWNPGGVAVNRHNGEIYVADTGHGRVLMFSRHGAYISQFRQPHGVYAPYPTGLAVAPSGDVYVGETDSGYVFKYSASGKYLSRFLGGGPTLAIDPSTSTIFMTYGTEIARYTAAGHAMGRFWDHAAGISGVTYYDLAVDPHSHDLYATYQTTRQFGIVKFTPTGKPVLVFATTKGSGAGELSWPAGVAVDSHGDVYVGDGGNYRIEKFSSSGTYLSQFGHGALGKCHPIAIALDPSGNLYVVAAAVGWNAKDAVMKFSPSGKYLGEITGNGGSFK